MRRRAEHRIVAVYPLKLFNCLSRLLIRLNLSNWIASRSTIAPMRFPCALPSTPCGCRLVYSLFCNAVSLPQPFNLSQPILSGTQSCGTSILWILSNAAIGGDPLRPFVGRLGGPPKESAGGRSLSMVWAGRFCGPQARASP